MSTVNILVVGTSGAGKSSLCNTIAGIEATEHLLFDEGEGSVSVTRASKCATVNRSGLVVKIVDTIGLDDTTLTETQVLQTIADACRGLLGGVVHQLIYVERKRINQEVLKKLVQVQDTIFGPDIRGRTTVVRTQFPKFKDAIAVERDKQEIKDAPLISNLFGLAPKILYVDNPPLSTDEDLGPIVLQSRKDSASHMLAHIQYCAQTPPSVYTGPFTANPISFFDRDERIRLENERKAKELEALRRRQEEEERVRQAEVQRRQRELEQQRIQQEEEIARLNREREAAQAAHELTLRNIRGSSRDTGGQVRDYVVYSNGNGRYIKLRGSGRYYLCV